MCSNFNGFSGALYAVLTYSDEVDLALLCVALICIKATVAIYYLIQKLLTSCS